MKTAIRNRFYAAHSELYEYLQFSLVNGLYPVVKVIHVAMQ